MAQFQYNEYSIDVDTANSEVQVTGTAQTFEIISQNGAFEADPLGDAAPLTTGDAVTRPGMVLCWKGKPGVRFDLKFEALDMNTMSGLGPLWPFTVNSAHWDKSPASASVVPGITGWQVDDVRVFAAPTALATGVAVKYTIRARKAGIDAELDPVIIVDNFN